MVVVADLSVVGDVMNALVYVLGAIVVLLVVFIAFTTYKIIFEEAENEVDAVASIDE
ncbi:MAG: hypothetical protein ACTSU5_08685 [Promethearchaeota archaeon]